MDKRQSNPFVNALRGIWQTFASERNFKIHLLISSVVVVAGAWLGLSAPEWRWVALCIALVLVSELLNTAIEALVDLASPTYHPLAKRAKDIAAGGVLLAAVFAVIVGGTIFVPKLLALFP